MSEDEQSENPTADLEQDVEGLQPTPPKAPAPSEGLSPDEAAEQQKRAIEAGSARAKADLEAAVQAAAEQAAQASEEGEEEEGEEPSEEDEKDEAGKSGKAPGKKGAGEKGEAEKKGNWLAAGLSGIADFFKKGWDGLKDGLKYLVGMVRGWFGIEKEEGESLSDGGEKVLERIKNLDTSDFPGKEAVDALKKAVTEKPDLLSYVEGAEKKYGIPKKIILSFVQIESRFNPEAVSRTGATGYGQFVRGTWNDFLGDSMNSDFVGKSRKDPEAGIYAIAWYCKQNATKLGINLEAEDAVARLYEAHHDGTEGYRRLQTYRETGEKQPIPGDYGKTYPSYAKYAEFISSLSANAQVIAESYGDALTIPEATA